MKFKFETGVVASVVLMGVLWVGLRKGNATLREEIAHHSGANTPAKPVSETVNSVERAPAHSTNEYKIPPLPARDPEPVESSSGDEPIVIPRTIGELGIEVGDLFARMSDDSLAGDEEAELAAAREAMKRIPMIVGALHSHSEALQKPEGASQLIGSVIAHAAELEGEPAEQIQGIIFEARSTAIAEGLIGKPPADKADAEAWTARRKELKASTEREILALVDDSKTSTIQEMLTMWNVLLDLSNPSRLLGI